MSLVGDYNLARVQVTVGDLRVTGWGESDALSLSPMSDLAESKVSADGAHVAISKINDPRMEATFTVKRNTAAYRLLMEKAIAQAKEADSGAVTPIAFQVYDPNSGDKVASNDLRFMRLPDLPFAKGAGEAKFKALLPSPTITPGALIPTSA